MINYNLKQELDYIYESYSSDLQLTQAINWTDSKEVVYEKLLNSMTISLLKQANEFKLINDADVNEYINNLIMSFKNKHINFKKRIL